MKKTVIYLISLVVLIQLVLASQCSDGIDNDGDNLNDTMDPGCYDTGSYDANDDNETDTLPVCSNNFDDDHDGDTDSDDWGCYTTSGDYNPNDSSEANPACSDGIDNDGDNKKDSQDYGCYTESGSYKAYDNDETNPQCSDEADNDGDCVTDYPADPGCNSVYDNSESPNPIGSLVICTEEFAPLIWMCDSRTLADDSVEPGRNGASLAERVNNYAFEGEQIAWKILIMDKNGIEKIQDVYATIGPYQGIGNDIEVNCDETTVAGAIADSCNARIGEELLSGTAFDPNTQRYYTCTFTVETPASMDGKYFLTAEVTDLDGLSNIMDENEYWYFNPTIALNVKGQLNFGVVRPGTVAYSDTLLVENDATPGSGVLMDMFISGTDLTDPTSSGAMCPTSNRIKISDESFGGANGPATSAHGTCDIDMTKDAADHLCYFASNGAYSTQNDGRKDNEGYVPIHYGTAFTTNFYNDAEIIATSSKINLGGVDYFAGNILSPQADIAITFKLGLPEPCNGDFTDGDIYFWGEAI